MLFVKSFFFADLVLVLVCTPAGVRFARRDLDYIYIRNLLGYSHFNLKLLRLDDRWTDGVKVVQ